MGAATPTTEVDEVNQTRNSEVSINGEPGLDDSLQEAAEAAEAAEPVKQDEPEYLKYGIVPARHPGRWLGTVVVGMSVSLVFYWRFSAVCKLNVCQFHLNQQTGKP